jgi:hypothetical protein
VTDQEKIPEWAVLQRTVWEGLVKEFLSDMPEVPLSLFHYTKAIGLCGIIESKSLWASHYAHLNDEGETTYRESLLDEAFELATESVTKDDQPAFQQLRAWTDTGKFGQLPQDDYVVSFSSIRDHLSQWERYAGPHGYALGFKPVETAERFIAEGFLLAPVIYSRIKQLELLQHSIETAMDRLKLRTPADNTGTNLVIWANNFGNFLHILCRWFKHDSFEEEAEWRATKSLRMNDVSGVEFRPDRFGIVPYISFPLRSEEPTLINELTVARTHYFDGAKRALELRLIVAGMPLDDILISHSSVPIRT